MYYIKGELDLKLGGGLFPCSCDLHIGGILTDETSAFLCVHCDTPCCLEEGHPLQALSEIMKFDWNNVL